MPEIPGFFITVPAPPGIRVRIVPATGSAERAGRAAGRKMPAVRGSVGNNSRSIAGHGKISRNDESEPDGGKDSQKGKDFLEGSFRIFRSRHAVADQRNGMACRKSIRGFFFKLSSR